MRIFAFEYHKHASMVQSWMSKHAFPLPPPSYLPTRGYVVEDTASGFLYATDSAFGFVEWVATNPDKDKEERSQGVDLLMETITKEAKSLNMQALFSMSGVEAYKTILKRNGFQESDTNQSHFVKLLGVS